MAKKKKKSGKLKKVVISILVLFVLGGVGAYYFIYSRMFQPNISLGKDKSVYFFIKTGSTIQDVTRELYEAGYIIDRVSFEWIAERKNYKGKNIHPGRYLLKSGMSNNAVINLLRSGEQMPVNITFNSIRTKDQLAGRIASQIEADSLSLINVLNDDAYLEKYNLNSDNILAFFIPNTYEFYWNTSADKFMERMGKEYVRFWTEERIQKARALKLSPVEVSVLASVVQAEQSVYDNEKPIVAGLYLNRLKKGMRLESDPTLVYAHGDFSINRVLNIHKEIDSPYNTYMYNGLPPGPINLPEISSLDAVLNYEKNDYLFMCAKEDFSGYHNFSKSYEQHLVCARRYRHALDKRKIMR